MNAGVEHKIWTRSTYGTRWTMKIDKTRWRSSVKRTIGWYGKRRMTNGHRSYNELASTSYYPWTKTLERTAGVIKLRGGGGEETSKTQNEKNKGMLGKITSKRTKWDSKGHQKGTYDTGTKLWKRQLHHRPDCTGLRVWFALSLFVSLVDNYQVAEVHEVRVDNCFWSLIKVFNDARKRISLSHSLMISLRRYTRISPWSRVKEGDTRWDRVWLWDRVVCVFESTFIENQKPGLFYRHQVMKLVSVRTRVCKKLVSVRNSCLFWRTFSVLAQSVLRYYQ